MSTSTPDYPFSFDIDGELLWVTEVDLEEDSDEDELDYYERDCN